MRSGQAGLTTSKIKSGNDEALILALVTEDETRPSVGGTKRCPYCGGWHSKRDPAVYCSPNHAKRSARLVAWL